MVRSSSSTAAPCRPSDHDGSSWPGRVGQALVRRLPIARGSQRLLSGYRRPPLRKRINTSPWGSRGSFLRRFDRSPVLLPLRPVQRNARNVQKSPTSPAKRCAPSLSGATSLAIERPRPDPDEAAPVLKRRCRALPVDHQQGMVQRLEHAFVPPGRMPEVDRALRREVARQKLQSRSGRLGPCDDRSVC